ncbi:hypothetical protein HaLaN_06429 [Haematococcus lacustris]|uniref:Uncharacterized protein n=1 Tax=Haematococcus lacustris TaxID=44745 RepID=A0A699YVG4_HAELA|nr:hypothetical protein HaLaN_06429 [Haematococcus lacustris]
MECMSAGGCCRKRAGKRHGLAPWPQAASPLGGWPCGGSSRHGQQEDNGTGVGWAWLQVHPALLTHALVDSAVERGAKLMTATVTGLQLGPTDNAVTGVTYEGVRGRVLETSW